MRRFKAAAEKKAHEALRTAKGHQKHVLTAMLEGGPGQGMLWSFDNPSIHAKEELEPIGITGADIADLPACSGDMHHVIEHIHGCVCGEHGGFSTWLAHHRKVTDPKVMEKELTRIFYTTKAASVKKSVDDLPGLWRAIVRAKGGYVDYKWR